MSSFNQSSYALTFSRALLVYNAIAHGEISSIEDRIRALSGFENIAEAFAFGLAATVHNGLHNEFDLILTEALRCPEWLERIDQARMEEALQDAIHVTRTGLAGERQEARREYLKELFAANRHALDYLPSQSVQNFFIDTDDFDVRTYDDEYDGTTVSEMVAKYSQIIREELQNITAHKEPEILGPQTLACLEKLCRSPNSPDEAEAKRVIKGVFASLDRKERRWLRKLAPQEFSPILIEAHQKALADIKEEKKQQRLLGSREQDEPISIESVCAWMASRGINTAAIDIMRSLSGLDPNSQSERVALAKRMAGLEKRYRYVVREHAPDEYKNMVRSAISRLQRQEEARTYSLRLSQWKKNFENDNQLPPHELAKIISDDLWLSIELTGVKSIGSRSLYFLETNAPVAMRTKRFSEVISFLNPQDRELLSDSVPKRFLKAVSSAIRRAAIKAAPEPINHHI